MKQIATLFLSLFFFSGPAQNFKFMDLNDTLDFRTEEGMILHAYIDTFRVLGNDTMFYMNREFAAKKQFYMDTCAYDSLFACWMADSVYKKSNSITFFHPNFGLGINLDASLNQYNVSGYQYQFKHDFRSQCIGITQNGNEIIRTYNIEALDSLFNPVPQQTNSLVLEISSTRGLLRFPCLSSQHPEIFKEDPFYKSLSVFDFQPITYGSLYNFSIGDEFQWSTSYQPNGFLNEPGKKVILNKYSYLPDSIVYQVERQSERYQLIVTGSNPPYRIDTIFYHDTINVTFTNLDVPISTIRNYFNIDNSIWWSFERDLCGVERLTFNEFSPHVIAISTSPCLTMSFEPGQWQRVYMEGIYSDYFWSLWEPGQGTAVKELVYQNTQNGSCGRPYHFSIGENIEQNLSFYPNPSHDHLRFDLQGNKEPFDVDIYNSVGQYISSYTISIDKPDIDLSALPAGVYIITSEKGNGRLIKN